MDTYPFVDNYKPTKCNPIKISVDGVCSMLQLICTIVCAGLIAWPLPMWLTHLLCQQVIEVSIHFAIFL